MMKNLKEMTWDMHVLHLVFFALGVVLMIVFVLHRHNPKLDMDPGLLIVFGAAFIGTAIWSFISCLFEKGVGQYQNPGTFQQQEDHELTTTH